MSGTTSEEACEAMNALPTAASSSLTTRKSDKDCSLESSSSSKWDKTSEERVEEQHVTRVYNEIALHFSETRHTPWPNVAHFLKELTVGSIVYDVGCGNGKYMNVNPNVCMIGADVSFQLARICEAKGMSTILSDVKCLPFRSDSGDNVISIAVLHHLASESGRMQALQEIIRVLRPHGTALISVWAFEQHNSHSGSESKYLKSKNKYRKAKTDEEEGRRRGPDAGNRRSEPLVQMMPKDQSPTAGGSDSYTGRWKEVTSSHLMPGSEEETEGCEGKESNNKHSSSRSYKHKSSVESSATRTVNRDERHEIQYSCQQATVSLNSHQATNLLPEELLPSLRLEKETSITREEAEMCTGTTSEAAPTAPEVGGKASNAGTEAAPVTCLVEGLLLPIHRNRTAFKSQDVLVPWTCKETGERLLRYYHVFVEHELRDLCVRIPGIRILTDYYDEGNWHVVIQKEAK